MSEVFDALGRTFDFDRIRFKMDEELLQQAALEVPDKARQRGQLVFDRYCQLHRQKYLRNYEPGHFRNGRVDPRFQHLYDNPAPVIRITLDLTGGPLFDRFIGMPVADIEDAIKRDPRTWFAAGHLVAVEK